MLLLETEGTGSPLEDFTTTDCFLEFGAPAVKPGTATTTTATPKTKTTTINNKENNEKDKTSLAEARPKKVRKPKLRTCRSCSRSFARLEHLKRHERSHTKEKPFECPRCSSCFSRQDLLVRHQRTVHSASNNPPAAAATNNAATATTTASAAKASTPAPKKVPPPTPAQVGTAAITPPPSSDEEEENRAEVVPTRHQRAKTVSSWSHADGSNFVPHPPQHHPHHSRSYSFPSYNFNPHQQYKYHFNNTSIDTMALRTTLPFEHLGVNLGIGPMNFKVAQEPTINPAQLHFTDLI
ncbi:hypothetical protein FQN54_004815 [Arachnomyces sp. PD_36]|nr:hypothetical protein FQN54_004815 [Arachnomyces sp. PD_36]